MQAVERAEALADDRHPDRQADQDEQVRAGARAARSRRSARRGRSARAGRRSTSRREPTAISSTSSRARGDHDERSISAVSMFPHFAATIAACTARSLRRRISRRTWPACGRRVHRGGVIFPDGCVDLVWRGDAPGRRRARRPGPWPVDRASATPVSGVRFRLGVAGAGARPAGRASCWTRRCRSPSVWGEGVDERVAAGGMPALLDDRARARARRDDRPARARRGAGDGRPGRARGRARRRRWASASASCAAASPTPSATGRRRSRACCASSASSRWRGRRRRPRAARVRGGLRRPGPPHPRGAPARPAARPLELWRPARGAGGGELASDSFKPRGARGAYRAA